MNDTRHDAPATATLLDQAARSAVAEERMRFEYFVVALATSGLLMGLGYGVIGNWGICLTGAAFCAVTLAVRAWALHGEVTIARLQQAVQLATAISMGFIFWQMLGLHEAVAAWYLSLLPLGVAIFCGLRATLAWLLITVLAIALTTALEQPLALLWPETIAPPVLVVARLVLTLIITVFGLAARRGRDQHVRALNAALQALQRAQQEAQQANEAKSAFLATMSHELRTPLNAVIGLNSLMLESPLPPLQRHQAELACQAGEAMLHLINEILDFSRIEAGRLELERQVFSPRQVMEDCLALVAARAADKQLTLRSEIEVPLALYGDAGRLRQILLNLLTNAIKFTPGGEVVLRGSEHPCLGRSWLYVEVRDTGIGIEPQVLSRIFQPFTQADASTTRLYGGTGLGLAICRGLVAAMGGKLGVNSTPGQGSTFWFELPFEAPPASLTPAAPAPAAAAPRPAATRPARILLAEDNSTNQFVAMEMFRRLGHELHLASNGQEALAAVRTQRFDIIFMDCHMPVLDGLEATRAIRAEEAPGQRTPIVALTALAYRSDRERCLAAGMDDYLTKPVRLTELAQVLARWLPAEAAPPAARPAPATPLPE